MVLVLVHAVRLRRNAGVGGSRGWGHGGGEYPRAGVGTACSGASLHVRNPGVQEWWEARGAGVSPSHMFLLC